MGMQITAADVYAVSEAINECSRSIERGAAWARDGAETIAAAIDALTAAKEQQTEIMRELLQAMRQPEQPLITSTTKWK